MSRAKELLGLCEDNFKGNTFKIGKVTFKVIEKAKGFVLDKKQAEGYWVRVLSGGPYKEFDDGEELAMSVDELTKYLSK